MPFDDDEEEGMAAEEEDLLDGSEQVYTAGFGTFARKPRSQRARHYRTLIDTPDASSEGVTLVQQFFMASFCSGT